MNYQTEQYIQKIRVITWDDVIHHERTIFDYRVVFSGGIEQIKQFLSKFRFRPDCSLFGGYWVDDNNGNCYIIT